MIVILLVVSMVLNASCEFRHRSIVDRSYHEVMGKNRQRRAIISFPDGSNFVPKVVFSKSLFAVMPTPGNCIFEADVPFKLPSTYAYRTKRNIEFFNYHEYQRREILEAIESFLTVLGLDGAACARSIQCEAYELSQKPNKTFIEELLTTVFRHDSMNFGVENPAIDCQIITKACGLPILEALLNPGG